MSIFDFLANVAYNRALKRDGLLGNVGEEVPRNQIVESDSEKSWHLSGGTLTKDVPEWKDFEWNVIAKYGEDK